jgi:hypothetical protein
MKAGKTACLSAGASFCHIISTDGLAGLMPCPRGIAPQLALQGGAEMNNSLFVVVFLALQSGQLYADAASDSPDASRNMPEAAGGATVKTEPGSQAPSSEPSSKPSAAVDKPAEASASDNSSSNCE